MFKSIYTRIISNIQKSCRKSSGWIIDSIIGHTIGTSVYNPLAESSYMQLTKDLDHPRKRLIKIQCIYDNECFKLCLIRY